jgi:hypothetical protein
LAVGISRFTEQTMTRGVVIFATDSDKIKYSDLAKWSQQRIERHLSLPVTILSNNSAVENVRWFDDFGQNIKWHNLDRCMAYDLSPYDQTLVLDADYVVNSDRLACLFDVKQSFLCHGHACDVTGQNDFDSLNYFGKFRMPMAWATVMYFERSKHAQAIFEFMKMVQKNWQHYRDIYQFNNHLYRNDYALSIALTVLNGYRTDWPRIPWPLLSIEPKHVLKQNTTDGFRVEFTTSQGKSRYIELEACDFHAMGKKTLGELIAYPA